MSYQLRDLDLSNAKRKVTNSDPLYIPIGAISGCDATTLAVSVVVQAVANIPAETAALMLQESLDGGLTWSDLGGLDADTITGVGTFKVRISAATGIPSPHLRLKVTPTGDGQLYIGKAFASFCPGQIVPRTSLTFSTVDDFGASSGASRVAALIGNESGAADFGVGEATDQTLRVSVSSGGAFSDLAKEATLLDLSVGVSNIGTLTAQIDAELDVISTGVATLDADLGILNSTSSDIKSDTALIIAALENLIAGQKPKYSSAYTPVVHNFSTGNLIPGVWAEFIAATEAESVMFQYINDTGEYIELGFGAQSQAVLGTSGEIHLHIPAGYQLELKCVNEVTSGILWFSAFV